jgi:Ser/Thr protein kinase RdoA (MazF antagonist)
MAGTMNPPEDVLNAYGLSSQAVVSRAGGTRNANFCVRDKDRAIFLRRRHPDYCDEGWVRFDHDALSHLARRGVSVNVPLSPARGGSYLRRGDDLYEAYPWVEGNAFPDAPEARLSLAENLAIFHREGASYPGNYAKGGYLRGEMSPARLANNLNASKGISQEGDNLTARYLSEVALGGTRLSDEAYDGLPQALIHGDVQPGNTIFSGSRLQAFVDVDWMSRQPVIYDLAYALILFCARRESPIDGADIWSLTAPFEFDEKAAREFLEAYLKTGVAFPPPMRPALMEQLRLTWAHIRIDGARKVPAPDRPRFLARDPSGPFDWIEARRAGDWF